MKDYIELRINISPASETATDLLSAFLADVGFESFLPNSDGLTAYIHDKIYDKNQIIGILESFPMDIKYNVREEFIKGRDWNEEWEKNYFQPIIIDNRCVIHSTFHKNVPKAEYDISIDPKMAFGTGHHSTTCLMLRYLLHLDLKGMRVIDMGTGTGILAILCCKRGASSVTAIEIDEGAWENAQENARLNSCNISILHGDASMLSTIDDNSADLFIANINRNIILADLPFYVSKLSQNGIMLLSGFYEKDVDIIDNAIKMYGLHIEQICTDNQWAALKLRRCN